MGTEKGMPALPKVGPITYAMRADVEGYRVPRVGNHLTGVFDEPLYSKDQMHAYAQQYAEQRVAEEREACLQACKAEHLEDPQDREDDAYDRGVFDCISAIRRRSTP